jgi:hypothetical protein
VSAGRLREGTSAKIYSQRKTFLEHEPRSWQKYQTGNSCALGASQNGLSLLDLKNFHEASHHASLVPILIATGGKTIAPIRFQADADNIYRPIQVNLENFRAAIDAAAKTISSTTLDEKKWAQASYHPTPTIVEAARSLYAR